MLNFSQWIRLNESVNDQLHNKLKILFEQIESYCTDQLVYDDLSISTKPNGILIEFIHEPGKRVWVYDNPESAKVQCFIDIIFSFDQDPDKQHLAELGLIDDIEMVEEINAKYITRTYLINDEFDIGDIGDSKDTFDIDKNEFFPNGDITRPNFEYFMDGLISDVYRTADYELSVASDRVETKLEEFNDEEDY